MEKKNIYQRILAVMAEVDYIQKGEKKVGNLFRFVSHDQVSEVLHPQFVKHGIACIPSVKSLKQDGNRTEVCVETTLVNVDDPSDKVSVESWGYGIDQADKGPGKGISYACKYALLKLFCLETGDDPDQDQHAKFEHLKRESEEQPVDCKFLIQSLNAHFGKAIDFSKVEAFVRHSAKANNIPEKKVIAQALEPDLINRFVNSYIQWKDN